jgi:threonylcarbamoyladenosine tRNA methylthiotransferase MtaB
MDNRVERKSVAFYTLGCKVNQYDTQAMMEQFESRGYRIVDFDEKADVYVVNTCTVTNLADRKSRQMIRKAHRTNPDAAIVVVGCFAQRSAEEAIKIPGVKLVLGTQDRHRIVDLVEQAQSTGEVVVDVKDIMKAKEFESTPISSYEGRTRAILKVQEGCNQFCTYCIIPYTRGPIRSRHPQEVLEEARRLAGAGFKEIVLTGIHLASYGMDLRNELEGISLVSLLEGLNSIEGLARIRLGSIEPNFITPEFVDGIQKLRKVCRHFHVPLQSGSDTVLKRMNRRYTTEQYSQAIGMIRQSFPDAAITTDVMVGFPGETDTEFEETVSFVQKIGFSRLHVFQYSRREGTPAAKFPNQVPARVKDERSRILIDVGHRMARRYMERFVGRVEEVYFEQESPYGPQSYEGYTQHYIRVVANSQGDLKGQILKVLLKEVRDDYMVAEVQNG